MIDLTRCTKFICILFDFFLLLVLPILYKKQYNLYCKAMLQRVASQFLKKRKPGARPVLLAQNIREVKEMAYSFRGGIHPGTHADPGYKSATNTKPIEKLASAR